MQRHHVLLVLVVMGECIESLPLLPGTFFFRFFFGAPESPQSGIMGSRGWQTAGPAGTVNGVRRAGAEMVFLAVQERKPCWQETRRYSRLLSGGTIAQALTLGWVGQVALEVLGL